VDSIIVNEISWQRDISIIFQRIAAKAAEQAISERPGAVATPFRDRLATQLTGTLSVVVYSHKL